MDLVKFRLIQSKPGWVAYFLQFQSSVFTLLANFFIYKNQCLKFVLRGKWQQMDHQQMTIWEAGTIAKLPKTRHCVFTVPLIKIEGEAQEMPCPPTVDLALCSFLNDLQRKGASLHWCCSALWLNFSQCLLFDKGVPWPGSFGSQSWLFYHQPITFYKNKQVE